MGIKLKSITCVNTGTIERPVTKSEFDWVIYNKLNGHIVALTYSQTMARVMVEGLNGDTSPFINGYAYAEVADQNA